MCKLGQGYVKKWSQSAVLHLAHSQGFVRDRPFAGGNDEFDCLV